MPKYLSSTQINNLPTNWAISYDIKGSAIMIGYMYGVFWPIRDIHRLFKAGLGVGISRLDNSININLCDSYTESPVKSISRDSPHVELSLFFSPRT